MGEGVCRFACLSESEQLWTCIILRRSAGAIRIMGGRDGTDQHLVTTKDMSDLRANNMITTNVVDAATALLAKQFPGMRGLQGALIPPSGFNGLTIAWSGAQAHHVGVPAHFMCSFGGLTPNPMDATQPAAKEPVYVMDTLFNGHISDKVMEELTALYVTPDHPVREVRVLPSKRQTGFTVCGVLTIANLTEHAFGVTSASGMAAISWKANKIMYAHLIACLELGQITPFPRHPGANMRRIHSPNYSLTVIDCKSHCKMTVVLHACTTPPNLMQIGRSRRVHGCPKAGRLPTSRFCEKSLLTAAAWQCN